MYKCTIRAGEVDFKVVVGGRGGVGGEGKGGAGA